MDNRKLVVSSTTNAVDGSHLEHYIGGDVKFGSKFVIQLPQTAMAVGDNNAKWVYKIFLEKFLI